MRGDQARAACPDIQLVQASAGPPGLPLPLLLLLLATHRGASELQLHTPHHSCLPACLRA